MGFFGRSPVLTDAEEITRENVVDVLDRALMLHNKNQGEITYLWNYYRGIQPVLEKTKEVRPEINHKIVVNRAHEIVSFKLGYGFGEPVQLIRRGQDQSLTDDINRLNSYMFAADKTVVDRLCAEWMYVCGLGLQLVLPDPKADPNAPFALYALDPRDAFVVRSTALGSPPVMGVVITRRVDGREIYTCYAPDKVFTVEHGTVTEERPNVLGAIPLVEFPAGQARLGAFEIVLPLLDALNDVESNRLDDLVQYVNSFLALLGGQIDEETVAQLQRDKMLCLPDGVDAKYLSTPMSQGDVQNYSDSLYEYILTICGLPNRNGGSSTSDTGAAVIMRDGWESAESQMQAVELLWKKAQREQLQAVLTILDLTPGVTNALTVDDVEIKFSRRNYEGILTKSQVLISMLACPKIHPELAFNHCGLFLDPETAYLQSKVWWEENEKKQLQTGQAAGQPGAGEDGPAQAGGDEVPGADGA